MYCWKLLHTDYYCCYWSTHLKSLQAQKEEPNLPLSLGNIWDITNPGQAPDNWVEVSGKKQKIKRKVQTRYSNSGVGHTHLWCENWKHETCIDYAIKHPRNFTAQHAIGEGQSCSPHVHAEAMSHFKASECPQTIRGEALACLLWQSISLCQHKALWYGVVRVGQVILRHKIH